MSEPEYKHRSFRTISKSFGFSGKAAIKLYKFVLVTDYTLRKKMMSENGHVLLL